MSAPLLRMVADEALRWRAANPDARHWGDAVLMLGLTHASGRADPAYLECAAAWLDAKLAQGIDYEAPMWDWGALPLAAMAIYQVTEEARYWRFAEEACRVMREERRRTADGGLVTHGGDPQLWVDTMYFSAPALAHLGALTSDDRYLEEAVRQVDVHTSRLRDEGSGLFYHMWDEATGRRTPCLWARGNGWAALSTLEVVEALPSRHRRRGPLLEQLRRQMEAVARLRDASGLWHTVIDRPNSYLETSCAAMFTVVIARGVRSGLLPEALLPTAHRAWEGVQQQITPEGQVTGVSAGTPPGDLEVYQRVPLGTETFGTGFVLLAAVELERLSA